MPKTETGTPLDKLLEGGLENDAITNIYGPAGSGKTNIALLSAITICGEGKKAVYVDTEGSFSLDRFEQLGGDKKTMGKIVMISVHTWEEQNNSIAQLESLVEKDRDVGIIIVDSLVALYRLELEEKNFPVINKQLATQYSNLSKIVRKYGIPVLVTNQVYSKDNKVELTSREIARYWSKTLVELKKLEKANQRLAVLRKHRSLPESRSLEFEITKDSLKPVGRFSIL